MAASVEVRVPLLDDELVALAGAGSRPTSSCTAAAEVHLQAEPGGVLPHDIIWRRKAGFGRPDALLAREGPRAARPRRCSRRRRCAGAASSIRPTVARLTADNASGRADNSLQIYALLTLELWMQTFMDRKWEWQHLGGSARTDDALIGGRDVA